MNGMIRCYAKSFLLSGILMALGFFFFFQFCCTIPSLCFQKYAGLSFKKVSRDKIDHNFSNISTILFPPILKSLKPFYGESSYSQGHYRKSSQGYPNVQLCLQLFSQVHIRATTTALCKAPAWNVVMMLNSVLNLCYSWTLVFLIY